MSSDKPSKERPILFKGQMVRALLDGTKTQTRRIMKFQPYDGAEVICEEFHPTVIDRRGEEQPGEPVFGAWWADGDNALRCPYGAPGDRLWVRETFAKIDGQTQPWIETDYRASYTDGDRLGDRLGIKKRWTPAIHMPRVASRIALEVSGVRVERLQEISEADAVAEGLSMDVGQGARQNDLDIRRAKTEEFRPLGCASAVDAYRALWESINGADSWNANPWVWVLTLKKVSETPTKS